MRFLSRWVLLCSVTFGPLPAFGASFQELFKGHDLTEPGCVVGVARPGQPITYGTYGAADLEHAVPVTTDTIMEAGSIAKQFTATAILMLAEEGKLALTDNIRKYLPEMPDYGTPITINHLLSHTNGLRDWGAVYLLAGWPRSDVVRTNREVHFMTVRQRALNYKPGEAYSYNNTGFNLATFIVERVSGKSLPEFTRERIFTPFGMSKTSWRNNFRAVLPNRAIAYRDKTATQGYTQEMPFEDNYGHGGLLTTARDLLTWNDVLSSRKLGDFVTSRLEERAVLTNGRKIAYARGLQHGTYNGLPEISHGGGTAAYRAWLARYPTQGMSVAVLCNGGGINATRLGREAVERLRPTPTVAAAEPKATKASAAELAELPGLYIDERTGRSGQIVASDGALKMVVTDTEGVRETNLVRLAARRYRNGGAEMTFKAAAAEIRAQDGEVTAYRKVDPYMPPAAELNGLLGRYASVEADAMLELSLKDGRLMLSPVDRPSGAIALMPLSRDVYLGIEGLVTIVRNAAGSAEGLRFIHPRVYSMVFTRTAG